MSNRKQRREIDKAIAHLIQYFEEDADAQLRMDDFLSEIFTLAAKRCGISIDEAQERVMSSQYSSMAFGFLFEAFVTASGVDYSASLIDVYLQQRGWREGVHGRRYLRALSESTLKLWEVVESKPGVSLDVCPFGTSDKPIRVKEQAASQTLRVWHCIAARVLRVEGEWMFAGGMLSFTPAESVAIHRTLEKSGKALRQTLKKLQKSDKRTLLPDDLDAYIDEKLRENIACVAFTTWCIGVLEALERPLPRMVNMDQEPIELTRQRFPVTGDRAQLLQALNSSSVLSADDENGWTWLPKPHGDIAEGEQVSILGMLRLKDDALELETNSANRAARGRMLIQNLAGEHLGEPLTLHENLEKALEDRDWSSTPAQELNSLPEVQALLQSRLTAHYRQTLDEPIPMLGGKTPRACAANSKTRKDVVAWLKELENTGGNVQNIEYDFGWMWRELGLDRE